MRFIGERAFSNNKLKYLEIPQRLKSIGYSTFENNEIDSVIISETVERIDSKAFKSQNRKLKRVIILGEEKRFIANWEDIGFPSKLIPT